MKRLIAAALLALTFTAPVSARMTNEFYFGAAGGFSDLKTSDGPHKGPCEPCCDKTYKHECPCTRKDIYFSNDSIDFGQKVFIGWDVSEKPGTIKPGAMFGLEYELLNLGMSNDVKIQDHDHKEHTGQLRVKGQNLSLVLGQKIEEIDVLVKVGLSRLESQIKLDSDPGLLKNSETAESSIRPSLGIGLNYKLSDHITARTEVEMFVAATEAPHVDTSLILGTVGLIYVF